MAYRDDAFAARYGTWAVVAGASLLLPRQTDDDKRCASKYGALWEEYCRRVPYRIIPGVY